MVILFKIDLTGQKFGKLTVIEEDFDNKTKKRRWICICECGAKKSVDQYHLRSGATVSCGCYQKQKAKAHNIVHGQTKTPLHNVWKAIKQRCNNPNSRNYKNYGGRGIKLCDEWLVFENFYNWCVNNGYDRSLQIDRIDNDKGYEPNNVRFVDRTVNCRNRRITATISVKGKKISLATLEEIFEKNNIEIPSLRYKKPVSLRKLYNYAKTTFGEVTLEKILSYEMYMGIPSQVFEEIQERCND